MSDAAPVNERTIEELLEYDTEELLALDQKTIDLYLEKAIIDQEEILKRVPKKKAPVMTDLTDGGGGTMSKKDAAAKRNAAIALPAEFANLAAETQALLFEAQKFIPKK